MAKKEPLVPTSLDGLIGEFAEPRKPKRDEHGKFIHEGQPTKTIRMGAVPSASAPATGSLWFNPGAGSTYVYDGSSWVAMGAATSGT